MTDTRTLADPDISAELDAEIAAMTPETARDQLIRLGLLLPDGSLSPDYYEEDGVNES